MTAAIAYADRPGARFWLGDSEHEARAAYERARKAGLSQMRALVVGSIASFRDCWAFRRTLARRWGISVRTVQRAITQARAEGLIEVHRAKKNEVPPDAREKKPLPCGWSHRWVIGRGKAGDAIKAAVAAAKAKFIVHFVLGGAKVAPTQQTKLARAAAGYVFKRAQQPAHRRWTAEELAAELERVDRERKPPPPE
jgi:DNA-binding transcriptional MocR family regulator